MKIAITQPNFLPWLGYFDLLDSVDIWVSLDNVQVVKRSFIVRNKVKDVNENEKWLTVSLEKSTQKTLINKSVLDKSNWHEDIVNKIKAYYAKARFFEEYFEKIVTILTPKEESLSKYNLRTVIQIGELLGIKVKTVNASEFVSDLGGNAEEKIFKICDFFNPKEFYNFKKGVDIGLYNPENFNKRGIRLFKQDYLHPSYNQLGAGFISYLSIIDLIFNEGPDSLSIIRKGKKWINT